MVFPLLHPAKEISIKNSGNVRSIMYNRIEENYCPISRRSPEHFGSTLMLAHHNPSSLAVVRYF
jgi:hypothetical protein